MTTQKLIQLSQLLVDIDNPRIADVLENQSDAIREIALGQGKKLLRLATDILEHGTNPAELLIVIPSERERGHYVVLEGNRRLTALKAMEYPELVREAVDGPTFDALQKLSRQYVQRPISDLPCVIFDTREDAEHWIQLRHTGQNEGAGLVPWGAAEAERFRRRQGGNPPHVQVLDFLEQRHYIDTATRRATPFTSLKRLLSTPYVREKLGIAIQKDGRIATGLDPDEVAKGLKRVVSDLALQRIKTGDIYHAADRKRYIDTLASDDLPNLSATGEGLVVLEEASSTAKAKSGVARPTRSRPSGRRRKTLIPAGGFALRVGQGRINEIYHELRELRMNDYPNAVSVLFRVFLELSTEQYICQHSVAGVKKNDTLSAKLVRVGEHLLEQGKIDEQQLKPVRRAAERDCFLGTTVTTMNQYVHNQHFNPGPSDMVATWDNLAPFFVAVWSD